ncbi:50S ribosomal protein L4 [Mesoterricola sediminis]|uniref:Large ribosomal subunit protein uL4 n=1 Tax=Mesoterricola sediminis TaxID=2927980 RepID=A0AA48KAQ8_9BACT|nr:50S ribosomal protein L4 [Mesoterricola sediminis]BDU75319.1 50S ribosomal protein L4 [Mesoterricola sediminis]
MATFNHPVVNLENKAAGSVELLAEVFKLEEVNNHLIWEAVRHHLARRRAGTAKTKDKSEVSGSGRKLWKQKGTGRARVGSIRSTLWKGGGTAHGPNPRCFDYAFPKRARRAALRNALSVKFASGQVLVVEDWTVDSHKTKALIATLGKIGVSGSALLVGTSEKAAMAAANNPKLATIESLGVNVYDLLKYDQVVFSKEAILALQEVVKP